MRLIGIAPQHEAMLEHEAMLAYQRALDQPHAKARGET